METKKKSVKGIILQYVILTFAALIYSLGISLFLDPNHLAPGGMTGVAIICSHLTSIPTGTWFFIFNIPVVILGIWKFGIHFIISTFYSVAVISFITNILGSVGALTTEPLLATLGGSVLVAVGMGMIFKAGATTGGTDIIVKILRLKFKHLKTGKIFLAMDAVIVTISGFVFKDIEIAMYAGIAIVLNSIVLDMILYGTDEAKLVYVISDKPKLIAQPILDELEIGITYLKGRGAYTDQDKEVILCVVKKSMYPKLEEIVKQNDPMAFMIVGHASEIFGEGYKNIFSEKV